MELKTAPIKLGSEGYFGLAVYKADGTEVAEKRVSDTGNVVTYAGAYNLFFGAGSYNLLGAMESQVGTGTTELTRASSGLGNLLATTTTYSDIDRSGNEVSNEDGTATLTATRTNSFSLGTVVGTISEVGLITRIADKFIAGQLIKDEFGDPTTLTILSDEQLVVTYTLVLTFPDGSGSISQGAPLVGSGTVTTPSGAIDYNMYTQPLFKDYAGDSALDTRAEAARQSYLLHSSSGNPVYNFGSFASAVISHDGTTGVSVNFVSTTVSPTDYSSSDISFISAGSAAAPQNVDGINTSTKLIDSSPYNNGGMLAVEFIPALTKTSSDSMTVHMTMDFVI